MNFKILLLLPLLAACGPKTQDVSLTRSLTDDDYTGKKYYFGFGAAAGGDPSSMHNEVKYDVLHTHDIFTAEVGGGYLGTKIFDDEVYRSSITTEWSRIRENMSTDDMYVQYSSGHGDSSGLMVGVSYRDIRDNALSYPAREIILFTMACRSGGLVNSFNSVRSQWEGWGEQGRTLFVMSSSSVNEDSSTGPGRDPDQPNGPSGSAGSAFGHALWKALIGYADGYVDGVKDGYISLQELTEFTTWKTEQVGGHTPVFTGVYNDNLVMNRVPSSEFIEAFTNTTEGKTDAEVAELVRQLDESMRIN